MKAEIAGLASTSNKPQQRIQYCIAACLRNDIAIINNSAVKTVEWGRTLITHRTG